MTDRGLDFQVDTYENAETLVEGYSNDPYDLIFLDIMMDEIDGIEAGRRIRAVDTKSEIVYPAGILQLQHTRYMRWDIC